ncbi:type I restriction modification DNA specificity domain protein [Lactobacillus iners LEAF 2062A-h1]|uniref:restriction endonuclease subunit S n=2 Tax=Lactobacillus iners TaxID=147802 RepID=UPI0001E9B04E|nr:restriction endonuclease subunit S [Lactobacillus iners]EFQ50667.1 type I restriction modification DNA specificity domain protein [Lactobacillus iners LEAF 2062A-h1]
MTNWKICTIGDLGMVIGGATPSTKAAENYDGGTIAWITPKDLAGFSGRFISYGERNITKQGLKSCSAKLMPKHTVLFSSRAPIGYIAIANQELCTNQGFKSVVPNDDTDYKFLYYLLKYNKNKIENLGSGTTFKEVSGSTMRDIEVSVPTSIEEQRKIASVLSLLDDKIEKNASINKNLEQQAQAIFKSWFLDYKPFNGVRPIDWINGTIDDLAKEVVCGKTPSTKVKEYYGSDVPFIKIPDMHGNTYVVTTEQYLSNYGAASQAKKTLPPNSICVSCIGTAGLVTLVASKSQTNQQINAIVPKDKYSPFYIYLLMQTLSEVINKLGQSGSTIVNLNKTQFEKIKAIIPSITDMKTFDALVSPLFALILENQKENIRLSSLRNTLLPKLMSGELDVSNLDL